MRKGEAILNTLERKIGWLSFPGLLRWIVIFQVLVWGFSLINTNFFEVIQFDRAKIFQGEVWRVFGWLIYPRASNPLFVLFVLFFTFFISDLLEGNWGPFRVTIYIFSVVGLMTMLAFSPFGIVPLFPSIFFGTVFIAAATIVPDMEIRLLGIIPIKMKWLALADVALLIGGALSLPIPFVYCLPTLLIPFIPYFLVFVPGFIQSANQRASATARRSRFESHISAEGDAFHECESCGATDLTNPEREFRVTAEGKELCDSCR